MTNNMLSLKSIKLKDFLSHSDTKIEFSPTQKLLLNGESGCGKSSIFESLIWCLYGQGRTGNITLIRRGQKSTQIEVEFEDEKSFYLIKRSITIKGKHTLEILIDGIAHPSTGVKELQEWIEKDLIGASYTLFINSIVYLQGGQDIFVLQNALRRKELLLEIVNTENFEAYYEKARTLISFCSESISGDERELEITNRYKEEAEIDIKEYPNLKTDLDNNSVLLEIAKTSLEEILKQETDFVIIENEIEYEKKKQETQKKHLESVLIPSLDVAEEAIKELEVINNFKQEISGINEKIVSCEEKLERKEEAIKKIAEMQMLKNKKLVEKPQINDYSTTLYSLNSQLNTHLKGEKCPAGDNCPHQKNSVEAVKKIRSDINDITLKIIQEKDILNKWQKEYDVIPKCDYDNAAVYDLNISRSELIELKNKKNFIENKILNEYILVEKINSIPKTKKEIDKYNEEIILTYDKIEKLSKSISLEKFEEIKILKQNLKESVNRHQQEQSKLQGRMSEIEKKQTAVEKYKEKIKELSKLIKENEDKINKLELLKDAFGSKGIKTVVIDWIIPALEDKINDILSTLSDFTIRLDTQKNKSDGEGTKEGLWITIINEMGEEMDYDNYSGGEKMRIIVAITEGLASLTKKIGFRMMDEAIQALSTDMTSDFTQVVLKLTERYPQVFMISHLEEIKGMFENQITIKKIKGISSLCLD